MVNLHLAGSRSSPDRTNILGLEVYEEVLLDLGLKTCMVAGPSLKPWALIMGPNMESLYTHYVPYTKQGPRLRSLPEQGRNLSGPKRGAPSFQFMVWSLEDLWASIKGLGFTRLWFLMVYGLVGGLRPGIGALRFSAA